MANIQYLQIYKVPVPKVIEYNSLCFSIPWGKVLIRV